MSKWTANCLPGVLKRSASYSKYLARQRWKKAQIIRLHNERIEAKEKGQSVPMGTEVGTPGDTVESPRSK